MARFMLIYKGEATDVSTMPPDEAEAVMQKWGEWMGKVGAGLVDVGAPFGPGASVVDDGNTRTPVPASGYSIVEAPDLDSAVALADGHPYLSEGAGDFAIDIFELQPVPFEA
jgi:hypothetical protein